MGIVLCKSFYKSGNYRSRFFMQQESENKIHAMYVGKFQSDLPYETEKLVFQYKIKMAIGLR